MSDIRRGLARNTGLLTFLGLIAMTAACGKTSAPVNSADQPTPATSAAEPQATVPIESVPIESVVREYELDKPSEAIEPQVSQLAPNTEERVDVVATVDSLATVNSEAIDAEAVNSEAVEAKDQQELIDDSFRLWLPTTAGGLLVRLQIQVGERSLQATFDGRIDDALTDAGITDGGSWDELLKHVTASPATFGNLNDGGQTQKLVGMYDRNRNRRPEREEAVNFLFRDSGIAGPFRLFGTDAFRQLNRSQSPLFRALDLDHDQRLSRDEIERASDSLRSIDHNGDQRIDSFELTEAIRDRQQSDAWNRRNSTRWGHVAMDLAGYIDWSMFADSLAEISRQAIFHDGTNSLANVDKDGDGAVSAEESRELLTAAPDLTLVIRWTPLPAKVAPATPPTIRVELGEDVGNDNVRLTETGDRVRLASDRFQLLITVRDQYASSPSMPSPIDPTTVTTEEADPPIWSVQVRARGAEVPDAIFAWLDEDLDGSLSTRELHACGPRLQRVANADGDVKPDDLPDTFLIQFVRGEPQQDASLFDAVNSAPPARSDWPRWAESMDMNRDGDIGADEFLGDAELFKRLDRNDDGYLDAAEAEQPH